ARADRRPLAAPGVVAALAPGRAAPPGGETLPRASPRGRWRAAGGPGARRRLRPTAAGARPRGARALARSGANRCADRVPPIRARPAARPGRCRSGPHLRMEQRPSRGAHQPSEIAQAPDVRTRLLRPAQETRLASRLTTCITSEQEPKFNLSAHA